MSPGRAERHGFEYYRHGTLSLYAALEVKTGKVVGKTAARHTSAEFIDFLGEVVASAKSAGEIHIILDNLSTHKTKAVGEFLEANPKVRFHFTPTYSSWLNQVEIWFSKIERDVIARGVFTSVADLLANCANTFAPTANRLNHSAGPTLMPIGECAPDPAPSVRVGLLITRCRVKHATYQAPTWLLRRLLTPVQENSIHVRCPTSERFQKFF